MAVAYTLNIDGGAAKRLADEAAFRVVTDTTRRVLNRATVLTPVDTGRLRAGNMSRVERTGNGARGEVFNLTDYASAVHDGSRAHTIRPKPNIITVRPIKGKYLRFVVDGQVVYARSVRMQKPLSFMVGGRRVFAQSVRMPARRGRPWLLRALKEIALPEGYRIVS